MTPMRTALVLACIIVLLEARGIGKGGSGGNGGKSSKSQGSKLLVNSSGRLAMPLSGKSGKSSGGTGLSAWGIISLIVIIVVGVVFAYYVSVFYPIVCAERGKYDVMDMTPV